MKTYRRGESKQAMGEESLAAPLQPSSQWNPAWVQSPKLVSKVGLTKSAAKVDTLPKTSTMEPKEISDNTSAIEMSLLVSEEGMVGEEFLKADRSVKESLSGSMVKTTPFVEDKAKHLMGWPYP